MGLLLLLGLFGLCVTVGVPVAFALAVSAIATFAYEGLPLLVGFKRIVSGVSVFSLLAIPFFIFGGRSEEHTSELQSLMRISYAVFCLKKKKTKKQKR